jgi:hypothetical protein
MQKPYLFIDADTEQYFFEVLALKYSSFHDGDMQVNCAYFKQRRPQALLFTNDGGIISFIFLSDAMSYAHAVPFLPEVNQGRVVEMNSLTSTGFENMRTQWCGFVDLGRL